MTRLRHPSPHDEEETRLLNHTKFDYALNKVLGKAQYWEDAENITSDIFWDRIRETILHAM